MTVDAAVIPDVAITVDATMAVGATMAVDATMDGELPCLAVETAAPASVPRHPSWLFYL